MTERQFDIRNETGLHTRPGNEFVKAAKGFSSAISIAKDGKTVDAKSLLKIMKLNIIKGDRITLSCEGNDEVEAMDSLALCLESLKE